MLEKLRQNEKLMVKISSKGRRPVGERRGVRNRYKEPQAVQAGTDRRE